MKILFYQWNAFMQKGIENALKRQQIQYETFFYQFENGGKWENDIVIYEDMKDLVLKAQYYLEHDAKREEIIRAGYRKVQELFTFDERIKVMFGRNEDKCL